VARDVARIVTHSEATPRSFVIDEQLTIGRAPESTVSLTQAGVSRAHARIVRSEGGYVIEDLESRNGTFVNGTRIQRQKLAFGDRIDLGTHATFSFERAAAEEQRLIQQQKMEAIGRLSAGVAHEFNNFLAVVLSSVEYLAGLVGTRIPPDLDIVEALDDATSAAHQAKLVTRQLVAFARPSEGTTAKVPVADLLREVLQLARRTFDRRIIIEFSVDEALEVDGDRGRLFQALMNLCINARDAMPTGGTLRLSARRAPRRGTFDGAMIEVSDTGPGIDEAVLPRLFEPFFTTKPGGRGTGLGLPLVYGIVKSHGGDIEVTSRTGIGTTFAVWLPCRLGGATSATIDERLVLPRGEESARSILVVEDEPLVRRSIVRILRHDGYSVMTAQDGAEAVELCALHGTELGAVVLDLNMPRMGGVETAAQLRKAHPSLRIIVLSGYAGEHRTALLAAGVAAVLDKPCDARQLLAAIGDRSLSGSDTGRAQV
jgi:signal transduction histidine kinase/ActR/RegA family two-component response regulator